MIAVVDDHIHAAVGKAGLAHRAVALRTREKDLGAGCGFEELACTARCHAIDVEAPDASIAEVIMPDLEALSLRETDLGHVAHRRANGVEERGVAVDAVVRQKVTRSSVAARSSVR